MADYLRTLPNLFDYFPGLGNDVGPCVTHHPRHLHAVPSGSVKENMELLFNIQHKIREAVIQCTEQTNSISVIQN